VIGGDEGRVARSFLVKIYQNREKYTKLSLNYQMAIKYTKWAKSIPNGHKRYQHFPVQGPPKFAQIGIFGLKINHLATLDEGR
jgi:hypothetical protein